MYRHETLWALMSHHEPSGTIRNCQEPSWNVMKHNELSRTVTNCHIFSHKFLRDPFAQSWGCFLEGLVKWPLFPACPAHVAVCFSARCRSLWFIPSNPAVGVPRPGLVRPGHNWPDLANPGQAWPILVRLGQSWPGLANPGQAWSILVRLGQS